jgi:hypothetical protein
MVNQWRRVKGKMDFYHKEKQEWCTKEHKDFSPLFMFSVFLPSAVLCG